MSEKPFDARKLKKIVAKKVTFELSSEREQGEIPSDECLKKDSLKQKYPPRTTGNLTQRKKKTFFRGSSSRGPTATKAAYRSIEEFQYRGYVGYQPTNYSKTPIVPDTQASVAALKKISPPTGWIN